MQIEAKTWLDKLLLCLQLNNGTVPVRRYYSRDISARCIHDIALYKFPISIYLQCESKKSPYGFLKFFPKRLGIFNQFFTHLLYDHFYTRVQILIQISPTFDKVMP